MTTCVYCGIPGKAEDYIIGLCRRCYRDMQERTREPEEPACTDFPCDKPGHDHYSEAEERHIALLKVAAPGMCGLEDSDLDRLREVYEG